MSTLVNYNGLVDRAAKVTLYEGQGLEMLHDDFAPDWQPGQEPRGTMTFDLPAVPPPLTPEQLLLEAFAKEANENHKKVLQAINNWGSLTLAQKDQLLKFLAKFYIVAGEKLGLFVL